VDAADISGLHELGRAGRSILMKRTQKDAELMAELKKRYKFNPWL